MNKKNYSCFSKAFLLIALLCCFCTRAFAWDFKAVNDEGTTIYYKYINDGKEAEVTYESPNGGSYSGDVKIPATATVDETTRRVTSIGVDAFYGCTDLTSVTIGKFVTSICVSAFYGCKGLKSVTIPNSVKTIDSFAFCWCTNLESVTIGDSVTSIGVAAFSNCSNLESVTMGNSVTSIGETAFCNCSSLGSITIPGSVTSIDKEAFESCSSLTEVTLMGKSLPNCGENIFGDVTLSNVNLYCKAVLEKKCRETDPWKKFNIIVKNFSITIPDVGIATGCFYDDLDFTNVTDVTAYTVTGFSSSKGKVQLTRTEEIPAETGFIVMGKPNTTYKIPATTTDYTYANMLVGVLEATSLNTTDGDYTNYVLGKDTDGAAGFFIVPKKGANVPANKAYLRIPTSAVTTSGTSNAKTSLSLSFDDDDNTTGISAIKEQSDSASSKTVIYNLNGQRKQNLTKGLNIVNGKKIFVK